MNKGNDKDEIQIQPLKTKPERITKTTTDTILLTPQIRATWLKPPFQREIRVNSKVRAVAEEIHISKVIPGVITIGTLGGKTYLIDAQHRLEAFAIAKIPEAYADVRILHDASFAEMGEEFKRLNSNLVRNRPDDYLRAQESALPALALIRSGCPFVGYDAIRRSENSSMLSMSVVLRSWEAAGKDTPTRGGIGPATDLAADLTEGEARLCISFLNTAMQAWGRDRQYLKLWGMLNLTICAWLYRRLVLKQHRELSSRADALDGVLFRKCLMRLSASSEYIDWLGGRVLGDNDRSPCFSRVKSLFGRCITEETGKAPRLPQPEWASGGGGYVDGRRASITDKEKQHRRERYRERVKHLGLPEGSA